MAMNRMDRIVLDPTRTYACTRTARTGVRVTAELMDYAPRRLVSIYTAYSLGVLSVNRTVIKIDAS